MWEYVSSVHRYKENPQKVQEDKVLSQKQIDRMTADKQALHAILMETEERLQQVEKDKLASEEQILRMTIEHK